MLKFYVCSGACLCSGTYELSVVRAYLHASALSLTVVSELLDASKRSVTDESVSPMISIQAINQNITDIHS